MGENGQTGACRNRVAKLLQPALLVTLVFIFVFQAENITGKSVHVVLITFLSSPTAREIHGYGHSRNSTIAFTFLVSKPYAAEIQKASTPHGSTALAISGATGWCLAAEVVFTPLARALPPAFRQACRRPCGYVSNHFNNPCPHCLNLL